MDFTKEQLLNLINESSNLKYIELSEIPNIDLYMDQVTTFMEDNLGEFKRKEEDKILTKTMINNYTKNQILPPPIKKKYSKEHIMLLILTYHLKQILSISNIHTLLSPISEKYNAEKTESVSIDTLYKTFLDIQSNEYNNFSKNILTKIDELKKQIQPIDEDMNILIFYTIIFYLIIQSSLQKKLAEDLIDTILKP